MGLRFLLLLLFTGCLTAAGFTPANADSLLDCTFAPAEDFIRRTVQRINDSWTMAEMEFYRAGDEIKEMPEEIAESIKQKVSESVKQKVDEAVDDAVDAAEDRIEEQIEEHF